jgi:uncharacterized membrane protein YedE/YeeE
MQFDLWAATAGGALIGLAAVLLMLFTGRIAGISGILAGCLPFGSTDRAWRIAFIAGLILAPLSGKLAGYPVPIPETTKSWAILTLAGLLAGFGTRMAGGCTSGHGVCGIARFSPRSLVATAVFMVTAMMVVAVMRHSFGV